MKIIKLLSISFLLLFQCCKTKPKKDESILVNKQKLVQDTVQNLNTSFQNELENKKFYFLEREEKGDFVLKKYPQYSGDFEMPKYVFKQNTFINGNNVMEVSEWNILKISKKDSLLQYILNMKENKENYDTLNLIYNQKTGFLTQKMKNFSSVVLIDSLHSNKIKSIDIYNEEE
ncbi:hypothetical protein [Capnocytophaga cynodegmi]|uniref:hypothetical protein n=1 Tax=Capnocytophaga cynodegmi TaxID=28189 RepID=UPI00385FD74C